MNKNHNTNTHIPHLGIVLKEILFNSHTWVALAIIACVLAVMAGLGDNLIVAAKQPFSNENPDLAGNDQLLSWGGIALAWLFVVVALLFFGSAFFIYRRHSVTKVSHTNRNLVFAFVVVWILGFLTYCVGMYVQTDCDGYSNFFSIVPMAIIHATGMFIGMSDISAVYEAQHNSPLFMMFWSVSHFLALACSFIFIIHQFGFYLTGEVRIWLVSRLCNKVGRQPKNLFVFWGLNERSFALAESIDKEIYSTGKEKDSMIVFVRTFDDEESQSSNVGFSRIFSMVKLKNTEIRKLRKLDCLVTTAFHQLSKAPCRQGQTDSHGNHLLKDYLSLASLTRLMTATEGHVHFFMFNEDEDLNIKCTNNIMGDEDIKRLVAQDKKIHINCHARHSAKTRGLEVENIMKYEDSLQIHIIDSSELAVFSLKDNPDYHPVRFVSVDSKACVTSPFRAAIIGFGETGQEAFKFLYEFGAFVKPDGSKSDFHCTIIDNNAKKREGFLYAKAPLLKKYRDITRERKRLDGSITNALVWENELCFYECDIDAREYWKIIKRELANGLSNLFVTIDNDDLAIETVVDFCNLAVRWIAEEKKINVYIRCYQQDNYEKLKATIDKLNGLYGNITIVPFGNMEAIFTYDIIVNKHYEQEAKAYNHAYSGYIPADSDECWKNNLKISRTTEKRKIWFVEDTERRRDQNFSNAMHAATKMHLLTAATGHDETYWTGLNLSRATNTPHYLYISDTDTEILLNVARCEHQRWIASSILQGQTLTDAHEPDVQHKKHTDLVPWNKIRKWDRDRQLETQAYDCDVVDTTIKLSNNKQTLML